MRGFSRRDFAAGWDSGIRLYQHLSDGRDLFEALPEADSMPDDEGDAYYADTVFEYARYYGFDVTHSYTEPVITTGDRIFHPLRSIGDSMRNASARRQFEQQARQMDRESAPRWREFLPVRTVLAPERILCNVDGEWLSFWFADTTHIGIDLSDWSLGFGFEEGSPLQLRGPDIPWYTLAIGYLTNGPNSLALPELAPLAESAAMPAVN